MYVTIIYYSVFVIDHITKSIVYRSLSINKTDKNNIA